MHTQHWKLPTSEKVNTIIFIVNVIFFKVEYNDDVLLPHVKMPILTEDMLHSPWQHNLLVV